MVTASDGVPTGAGVTGVTGTGAAGITGTGAMGCGTAVAERRFPPRPVVGPAGRGRPVGPRGPAPFAAAAGAHPIAAVVGLGSS